MTEHEIQKQIIEYLQAVGIFHWRNNTGRRNHIQFGYPGSPDIIGILPDGRFLGIEVKTRTGKQSPAQVIFQQNVEKSNGLYILARSIDDVKNGVAG